jgi:arginine/lysine/ornithine decarboxylase
MVLVATRTTTATSRPSRRRCSPHASTSPNQQIIASLDVARRQMELEGYELVMQAIQLAIEIRVAVNTHPLVSKYFRVLGRREHGAGRVPAVRASRATPKAAPPGRMRRSAFREDEFILDPTRMSLMCGTAGYDGTQFKNLLANEYEIQLNKTSRNSCCCRPTSTTRAATWPTCSRCWSRSPTRSSSALKSGGDAARTRSPHG